MQLFAPLLVGLLQVSLSPAGPGPVAIEPVELKLWAGGTPGAPDVLPDERVKDRPEGGDRHVRDVHVPTITVYLPEGEAAPRPAVVICPGGGYGVLALDKEGHDIARWFAESGVVGVVLKYRLPRPTGHVYGHEAPLDDARQALKLVRENAGLWSVDPGRVGIMGFSAGGHLAASASVQLKDGGPNFSVLVYPVITMVEGVAHSGSRTNLIGAKPSANLVERFSCELGVTAKTPPAFLVHTSDDPVKDENSLRYYSALRAVEVPAELHLFARGGHGYAMRRPELPVGVWPDLLLLWMKDNDFIVSAD